LVNAGIVPANAVLKYSLNDAEFTTALPTAADAGTYTVDYMVEFDTDNYEISADPTGRIEVVISKAALTGIVASLYGNTPDYSGALPSGANPVTFEYQRTDQFNPLSWTEWTVQPTSWGNYEIRAKVQGNDNYFEYVQDTNIASFDVLGSITVNVSAEAGSAPTINVWIDQTGSMTYADANFKVSGSGNLTIPNINSAIGVVKASVVNSGKYYYVSVTAVPSDVTLTPNVNITLGDIPTTVYSVNIYELYQIIYNANGSTDQPPVSAYKIHNREYTLAANILTMPNSFANGWNTASSGAGTEYASGASYTANVSQIFYAQYEYVAPTTHTITWMVDGQVFITTTPLIGSQILLPDVSNIYSNFNKYIVGWRLSNDESFVWGKTADANYVFYAVLSLLGPMNFEFKDSSGSVIHSTILGNNAASYMALSGISPEVLAEYNFNGWASQNSGTSLTASGSHTFISADGSAEEPDLQGNNTVGIVLIIIGVLGLGTAVFFLLKQRGILKFGTDMKEKRIQNQFSGEDAE
jgi:hypothetical protein